MSEEGEWEIRLTSLLEGRSGNISFFSSSRAKVRPSPLSHVLLEQEILFARTTDFFALYSLRFPHPLPSLFSSHLSTSFFFVVFVGFFS